MSKDKNKIAAELRQVATQMTESSKNCSTWTDLKASNEFYAKYASGWVKSAIRSGCLGDFSKKPMVLYVHPPTGMIQWRSMMALLKIEHVEWLTEFCNEEATKKLMFRFPECEVFEDELTNDELRAWYKSQSLARASILETLAEKIDGGVPGRDTKDEVTVDKGVTLRDVGIAQELTGDDLKDFIRRFGQSKKIKTKAIGRCTKERRAKLYRLPEILADFQSFSRCRQFEINAIRKHLESVERYPAR
jgi:hypothetical protein